MEFEEVFTSPLTTQTTCYSCGKRRCDSANSSLSDTTLYFATEMHILGVRIPAHETDGDNHDDVKTTCRSLPRNFAKLDCVGYTNMDDSDEVIEALAFIDPELIEDHEATLSSSLNLHRPSQVTTEKDDSASATTPNTDGRQNSKRTSMTSTVSGTTDTATNSSLISGGYHRKSQSELSKGSHTTVSDTQNSHQSNSENKKGQKSPIQTSMGRLVLRKGSILLSQALLDFRPLCPCVARWGKREPDSSHIGIDQSQSSNNDRFVGIWLGSADDATLRLYVPSPSDQQSLISVPLPEENFSVDSPVMAIDFCSVRWPDNGEKGNHNSINTVSPTTTHTLAIGCQDGTIQLITWSDPNKRDGTISTSSDATYNLFGDVSSYKLIVDGPLVCLKLEYNELSSLRVIVGSLCGYVCQLTYNANNRGNPSDSSWEGPYMVVEDLFNSSINMEESVLTVDVWNNYVAVGTKLGRSLLYATYDSENYSLVWQAVLPYPVHGIAIINMCDTWRTHNTTDKRKEGIDSSMMRLAVATRRSFHVFEVTHGWVAWRQKPNMERHSSELAKTRILKIFEEIRKENETSDSITRKGVAETIEDLLKIIEGNSQKNDKESPVDQKYITDVVCSTINDLIDRIEEHNTSENTSSIDSYDLESGDKMEIGTSFDPPQWEYSSSDEEVPLS